MMQAQQARQRGRHDSNPRRRAVVLQVLLISQNPKTPFFKKI